MRVMELVKYLIKNGDIVDLSIENVEDVKGLVFCLVMVIDYVLH